MKTPITYYGGKQRLCKQILSMMPPHKIYCEPYFGGGAVFFSKWPSKVEVINDHDERLITFYRQVVDNFDSLQAKVQQTLCSESEWLRAKGYRVVNPTRTLPCRWPWLYRVLGYNLTLLLDLWMLMRCDLIYKLPGWKRSKGANIESCVAYHFHIWTFR